MSPEAWLAARRPAPPAALAARLRTLVAEASATEEAPAADALLGAAESVLRRLLREGCATRQSALELLAADALATYAFEAAAAEPATLAERTERAMVRIAALADVETQSEASARGTARRGA